jgi:aspartate/methionine/tyrosine aminotransferase
VKLAGGKCIDYNLKEKNNYEPDFDKLEEKKLGKVKLMFVNYPQMPTGHAPTKELFEKIVAFGKKHKILIIHDNPYSFILPRWLSGQNPMSLLSVDGAKDVVIELNSLSKSHNMAGWRVGMLCGAKERIEDVLRFKSNMDSGMFLPVQLAAAKALSLGDDWHDAVNAIYTARREKVFELLDLLKCSYSKQQVGLFVWAKTSAQPLSKGERYEEHSIGAGGQLIDDILYRAGVFITPGGIFGDAGKNYIRVSLCSAVERFEEAIKRIKKAPLNLPEGETLKS